MRRLSLVVAAALLLSACAAIPSHRDDPTQSKVAAAQSDVDAIYDRYRAVRNAAIGLLDPKPLSTVESGPVLAIDSGSFEVSQRLSTTQDEESQGLVVTDVQTPSFSKYPLWFMATAYDAAGKVNRIQIFERESAVDPWLLVAAPQTVVSTELPQLRHDGRGSALAVSPSSSTGMAMSPQDAADAYAQALGATSPSSTVEQDDFIRQMRDSFDANSKLEGVGVTQDWAAEKVEHALRTEDGGALVFLTLLRLDTYDVQPGVTVSWPAGSPQEAFLADGISSSGKLRYYHQVLLYLPGGDKRPRALGQYGGVVGADGD
ncbi:hypothetical protein [Aeromicrobium sp.]|uniref:hypothetical protein n=1 Tax=Aeromicrobium sp. TaxID=1871063 RepID=UPI003C65B620